MNSGVGCTVAVLAALGSVAMLAACSGRGSSQVVVHVEDNRDIAGATAVAQQSCALRGGQARLIAVISPNSGGGPFHNRDPQPPDAVFECDPAR
jgi:hypothetical protein